MLQQLHWLRQHYSFPDHVVIPPVIQHQLQDKLKSKETEDSTESFPFVLVEQEEEDVFQKFSLMATEKMEKFSNVFILEHVWSNTYEKAYDDLVQNETLRNFCCQFMKLVCNIIVIHF